MLADINAITEKCYNLLGIHILSNTFRFSKVLIELSYHSNLRVKVLVSEEYRNVYLYALTQ